MLDGAELIEDIELQQIENKKQSAQMQGAVCRICHSVSGEGIFNYKIKRVIRSGFHMACQLFCKL